MSDLVKVRVELDQENIAKHGHNIGSSSHCCLAEWFAERGVGVRVFLDLMDFLDADTVVDLPDEFRHWQDDGMDADKRGVEPSAVLHPISFDLNVPRSVARAIDRHVQQLDDPQPPDVPDGC